ncbi:hypothetical protein C7974DRAFT_452614 [Boeremia exigua]|uniref:uncharacterized protein n=1 Tax=Boeremia exigua TaxID=749465 RepID=UPI001E8DCE4E|nr:uncharacterized protein C7974DRAFT_452614 [Boeremia exigua]KAH6633354.1 hypothetical protein C7974DRAFT_452614 [Boeremia exigua]
MTYERQQVPRRRKSWRTSDARSSQSTRQTLRQQSPESYVSVRQPTSTWAQSGAWTASKHGEHPEPATTPVTSVPPAHAFQNPNLIPVNPRRSYAARNALPVETSQHDTNLDEQRLPQIWNTSIDDLIRRAAHEYDLVMNYERDAEGGQRWLPEDVARIRRTGKDLHRDIFALRRWRHVVAEQGDQDKDMMIRIKREANLLKLLCERVRRAINTYEQKCEFELLRDGVYAQDEDGSFYKPIAPQPFMVADGYFQHPPRPRTEYENEYSRYPPFDYKAAQFEVSNTNISQSTTPWKDPFSLHLKHGLPFDVASQTSLSSELKADSICKNSESSYQPTPRRLDSVPDRRISKTDRNPTRNAHQRRSLSSTDRHDSPDSVAHSVGTKSKK